MEILIGVVFNGFAKFIVIRFYKFNAFLSKEQQKELQPALWV